MILLRTIPLNALRVSPFNVRKTGGTKVSDLATSIAEHGLLHNLTVIADVDDQYEVIDGGRRLAALQSLVKGKVLASNFPIPCLVRTDHDSATELSAAANSFNEPMHPADQAEAFKKMVDAGASIADVAARFSVSDLVVKQRLKLANVSPKLVDLYRAGTMNLEQLQTLALGANHEEQEKAWFGVKHDYERSHYNLRERLTKVLVGRDDRRLRFVGLEAYEAAGGTVVRDLFSRSDEGYIADATLLDRLVADKLAAQVTALRASGWSWVEINPKFSEDYAVRGEYKTVPFETVRREPTPAEADRLAAIEARGEELLPLLEALSDWESHTDEQTEQIDAYEAEQDALNEELEAIETSLVDYAPEVKALAGAVVTLGSNGIEVHPGRLRPGEKLSNGALSAAPKISKPAKQDHSDAVLLSLSAHRSAAARYHVMGDPKLALALTVEWLLRHAYGCHRGDADLLRLSATSVRDPLNLAPDLNPELVEQWDKDQLRVKAVLGQKDPLGWLMEQTQDQLLELLAIGVGTRFDGMTERGTHAGIDRLHQVIDFNMQDHWKPTAKQYLSRVSSAVVLKAVTEACGKKEAATLANLRKADLIAHAEPLLTAKKWLPKPLRLPSLKKPLDGKQKAAGDDGE